MIIVITDRPKALLSRIKAAIDEGSIRTWIYDSEGDFTHSTEQWRELAWLRPTTGERRLILNIVPTKERKLSRTVYAIYHGRFVEMLLTHFDRDFERASASALASSSDAI